MMFAPRVVCTFVALLAPAAFAQSTREPGEPIQRVVHQSLRDTDSQQRRAMLRASLKSQPDNAFARDATPQAPRLMGDQERADLRQQLRQQ